MASLPLPSVSTLRPGKGLGGGASPLRSPQRAAARLIPAPRYVPEVSSRFDGAVDNRTIPYALWLLRLALGAMFLEHVMQIVFGYVPADIAVLFGLPPGISPISLVWDALIGLALLYGVWPRFAALAGAATLLVAMFTAGHAGQFGWQLPLLWLAASVALAFAGDGAFALVPTRILKEVRQ